MSEEHPHLVTFPVLLIDQSNGQGVVADLILALQRGSGLFGPCPEQANLAPGESLGQAETNARLAIGLPKEWDISWQIVRRDGEPILRLTGGSLGGAFAIGMAKLLAIYGVTIPGLDRPVLAKLDLSQIAISTQVDPDGRLGPVGEIVSKLIAAAREEQGRRIHTVIAEASPENEKSGLTRDEDCPHLLYQPHGDFHLLEAKDLSEALRLLSEEGETRWGKILDAGRELPTVSPSSNQTQLDLALRGFFGREQESGIFLLTGGPHSGKTRFMVEALQRETHRLCHFIGENPDAPEAILDSLSAQVRREFGVAPQGERASAGWTPVERASNKLYDLLEQVSEKLSEGEQVHLWVDGLDRFYGPKGKYPKAPLPRLFKAGLPKGIFIVLTSRPGMHLKALFDPDLCERVDLTPEIKDEAEGGPWGAVWQEVSQTLGLLAVAREPLSAEDLAGLFGKKKGSRMGEILKFGGDFFRGWVGASAPLNYFHADVQKSMLKEIGGGANLHRALAEAGEKWPKLNGHAREYALRRLPTHQRKGGMWEKLADTLLNLKYVEARIESKGTVLPIFDVLGDYHESLEGKEALPQEQALREQVEALGRALDRESYVLKEDPSLLGQQLYNALVWDWDESTRLGREVRALAQRIKRPWLKLLHRLEEIVGRELLRILTGHEGRVNCLSVTPDGEWIVSGGDRTIRVWEGKSGKAIRILTGHTGEVTSVAISTDGKRIVSGGKDNTVRVWDAEGGKVIRTLTGHTSGVTSVAISADGQRTVSGGRDQTVRVWEVETGNEIHILTGHTGDITSVAITRDGKRVVSGSLDQTVGVWDVESGDRIQTLKGHDGEVLSVGINVDGKQVVSGGWDRTVRVWDAGSGREIQILKGHTGVVTSVAIALDGKRVVSSDGNLTVRVWDTKNGDGIRVFKGHTYSVSSVAMTENCKRVVSAGMDQKVLVWDVDVDHGEEIRALTGQPGEVDSIAVVAVNSVAISADGKRVVSQHWDGTVRVWDTNSGKEFRTLHRYSTGWADCVAITADGKRVVSGGRDQTVRVWHTQNQEDIRILKGHAHVPTAMPFWTVNSVAITPDGKRIVSGGRDQTVRVWDAESREETQTLKGHQGWVLSVGITPDGKRIVSGGRDQTVRVWDAESGEEIQTLKGHQGDVLSVGITPDGRWVVSGGADETIRVWDAERGEETRTFEGHANGVTSVAITPDGKRVASGGWDQTVRVWDIESRAEVSRLACLATVLAVSFQLIPQYLLAVDSGRPTIRPNVYILEIVEP